MPFKTLDEFADDDKYHFAASRNTTVPNSPFYRLTEVFPNIFNNSMELIMCFALWALTQCFIEAGRSRSVPTTVS